MAVGLDPSWYVQHVVVWDPHTDHMFFFLLEDWLSLENQKNGTVEKEVLASCKLIHISFFLEKWRGIYVACFDNFLHITLPRSRGAFSVSTGLHLPADVWDG